MTGVGDGLAILKRERKRNKLRKEDSRACMHACKPWLQIDFDEFMEMMRRSTM